jgi:hypothetical protein
VRQCGNCHPKTRGEFPPARAAFRIAAPSRSRLFSKDSDAPSKSRARTPTPLRLRSSKLMRETPKVRIPMERRPRACARRADRACGRGWRHGFSASMTERHVVGRNMAPMGHRRSWYACCWQAGSSQRTSITLGGIVDRRGKGLLTGEGRGSYAPRHSILMGRPQGHSDLCLVTIAGDKGILT